MKRRFISSCPSQVASALRQIASKIDASKNPDRTLVTRDIRALLAAVAGGKADFKVKDLGDGRWQVTGQSADGEKVDAILKIKDEGANITWEDGGETGGILPGDKDTGWTELAQAIMDEDMFAITEQTKKVKGKNYNPKSKSESDFDEMFPDP